MAKSYFNRRVNIGKSIGAHLPSYCVRANTGHFALLFVPYIRDNLAVPPAVPPVPFLLCDSRVTTDLIMVHSVFSYMPLVKYHTALFQSANFFHDVAGLRT